MRRSVRTKGTFVAPHDIANEDKSRLRHDPLPEHVSGSKGGPWYNSHTYPTKVPPETIIPFIEASTSPGAVIADPFCGSGMTGVAAVLSNRRALLSDLSPGATHLARNHTRRVEPQSLRDAIDRLETSWMTALEADLYNSSITTDTGEQIEGTARHTVWSEVYECPNCSTEVVLWDAATASSGPLRRQLECLSCTVTFDRTRQRPVRSEPANIALSPKAGGKLIHGDPSAQARDRIGVLGRRRVKHWYPTNTIDPTREMYIRSALHLRHVTTVADMFAKRPLLALSKLWNELQAITEDSVRQALQFAFTNTAWHASRMRRYNAHGGQRPLTGTLFIPQLISEPNVFEVFRHQVKQIIRLYDVLPEGDVQVNQGSATHLDWIENESVDYVFTDPPFGNNIHYADCNIVWESWLGDPTNNDEEIVVNKSRQVEHGGKTVDDYQRLLTAAFSECRRIVRPDGRVSIVFHNSDDAVWSALLDAVEAANLHQAEVSIMDKGQRSQKGYKMRKGELVPFYDLVMTFTPSPRSVPKLNGAGDVAIDIVTEHLQTLDSRGPSPKRDLDYLYSVAVGGVIRSGAKPVGLSLRAFEQICNENLRREQNAFFLPNA